ncbi:hypothetical protein [Streptomyces termitum]|uniref:glycine-rich domain-containing protein n=1 Tax=Streptomyces termitum TaxID=67368 RepID=UPI0033A6018A
MTSQGSGDPGHDFLRAIASFAENNSDKPAAANKPIKMGMVDYDYNPTDFLGGINPRILFDGEATVSEKRYPAMAGYYPLPGARVVLVPIGTTYLIIGSPQTRPLDPKVEVFSGVGSDTWNKPLGARSIRVQVQGSGGAGGGAPTTVHATELRTSAGSGGAGGGYGESWFSANTLADSVTVTVPAGGVGVSGTGGGSGSTASFGSYVSAAGGGGGGSLAALTTPQANPGGQASGQAITADLAIPGQGGSSGARLGTNGAIGGQGGSSHLGGGGRGLGIQTGSNVGVPGGTYGGGGSGGCLGPNLAAVVGGDGGQGVVIVTTYF